MPFENKLDKIALALDLATQEEISDLLQKLNPKPKVLKIGLELIASLGVQRAIELLSQLAPDSQIFLDFKLHDIPNTVGRSVAALKEYKQIKYLTVHALGGIKMLKEALNAADEQINIIAVTVLTSHAALQLKTELGLELQTLSQNLINNSMEAGIQWVVASVLECEQIKKDHPALKVVTPGIRLNNHQLADQNRVANPQAALKAGSDLLVIGRPVYQNDDPQAAWQQIIKNLLT